MYLRHSSQRIGRTALALAAFCLVCSPFASANIVYTNGPLDGQNDAWTINFGYGVADTFTLGTP